MRFALDSNILVYSLVRDDIARHSHAAQIIARAVDADCILPVQVLGEFLNVIRRKQSQFFGDACAQAEKLQALIPVVETKAANIVAGGHLALRHRLQFWDSVLCHVVRSTGAAFLLSDDLQDGRNLDGLHILNPFAAENGALLAELLVPAER